VDAGLRHRLDQGLDGGPLEVFPAVGEGAGCEIHDAHPERNMVRQFLRHLQGGLLGPTRNPEIRTQVDQPVGRARAKRCPTPFPDPPASESM
jgi:hypothetical protein